MHLKQIVNSIERSSRRCFDCSIDALVKRNFNEQKKELRLLRLPIKNSSSILGGVMENGGKDSCFYQTMCFVESFFSAI